MSNLPALIRAFRKGALYHITDDGLRTRCQRAINALPESHALQLEEGERCKFCGSAEDFEAINQLRSDERQREKEERDRVFLEATARRERENKARPELIARVKSALLSMELPIGQEIPDLDIAPGEIEIKHSLNADDMSVPITFAGERFSIKITIWNGEK